jgi:hypothetical protein
MREAPGMRPALMRGYRDVLRVAPQLVTPAHEVPFI